MKFGWIILGFLAGSLGVNLSWGNRVTNPGAGNLQTDEYLRQQAAALLPWELGAMDGLRGAPRYRIWAGFDPDHLLVNGTLELTFANPGVQPIDRLVFNMPANNEVVYGGVTRIIRVRENENDLAYQIAQTNTSLTVDLGRRILPGRSLVVTLDFETQLPQLTGAGYGILGKARRVISLAGWYPILAVQDEDWISAPTARVGDSMFADTSYYEVHLQIPAGYTLASTGVILEKTTCGERQEFLLVSGPVREFALMFSPRFQTAVRPVGLTEIRYSYLPVNDALHQPEEGLEIASQVLKAYQEWFGPYPYRELDLVESSIDMGGYEFPGLVGIDFSERVESSLVDYRWILAHEIAHQWWYGLVGNDPALHPWLDEGLATYSVVLYYEHALGQEKARGLMASYRAHADGSPGSGDRFTGPTTAFSDWQTYNDRVYYQGAVFFDDLRQEIGEEDFANLLIVYLDQNRFKTSEPAGLFELAEQVSGRDLSEFFEKAGVIE